jgi:uncharacterized protein
LTRKLLTRNDAKNAVYGGCILGGGGGGWIHDGLEKAELAFLENSQPELITVDELKDDDYVACVSLVGAPSAKEMYINSKQLIETVERMQMECNKPIKALMTNENGASTTINGWLQAAATGLPILDAPSNGRAHPTGSMGSMNLSEVSDYVSIQTFAGGKGAKEVKGTVIASLDAAASAVRSVSVQAGGMVAVCRNPVQIKYVKEHAAIGGISQAMELGELFLSAPKGLKRIKQVTSHLKGRIIHSGIVTYFSLNKTGGFDIGTVHVDHDLELTFWNEYMTVEILGYRRSTFPDLIMTFDTNTGMPLVSAEIQDGMEITVITIPKKNLKLSTTMFNEKLLKVIEPYIQKKIV